MIVSFYYNRPIISVYTIIDCLFKTGAFCFDHLKWLLQKMRINGFFLYIFSYCKGYSFIARFQLVMLSFTGLRRGGADAEVTFSSQKCLAPRERRLARHCWGNYLVWSIRGTQFWVQCFLSTVFYIPLWFVVTECLHWGLLLWICRSTKTFSQTVSLY